MDAKNLYNLFARHKEGGWIVKPYNAKQIYNYVLNFPKEELNILELGTGIGCGTAMMALALKDSGKKGHITSIEQTDKCTQIAKELIPKDLLEYITIEHVGVDFWQNPETPYRFYSVFSSIPEGDYNLIFVDGPGPLVKDGKLIDRTNGDVMKLLTEGKIKPGTHVAWDGRLKPLKCLEQYYGSNFSVTYQGEGTDFNVLERKDNEVRFEDNKYTEYKEVGYV